MSSSTKNKLHYLEQIIGRITIATLSTLIVFYLVDSLYGRFYLTDIKQKRLAYGSFSQRPYSGFGFDLDFQKSQGLNINELGFYGPMPALEKGNEYRIFILGGSTVANSNPPINHAIEAYFAKLNYKDIKAYNFGVSASILNMDSARLIFELSKFTPDLVIFYGGGNDYLLPLQSDPRPGYPPNFLANENNPIFAASKQTLSTSNLLSLFLVKSNLIYARLYYPLMDQVVRRVELQKQVALGSPKWTNECAQELVQSISLALKVPGIFGAHALFVYQPVMYLKPSLAEEEKKNYSSEYAQISKIAREKVQAFAVNLSADSKTFLDLSHIFDDQKVQVYTDGIHLLPGFQEKINAAVSDYLVKIVPSDRKL